MSKDNGGPAFPVSIQVGRDGGKGLLGEEFQPNTTNIYGGMTLRDYFAAKAMHAYLMWPDAHDWEVRDHAKSAYAMADAMLKEREK